MKGYFFNAQPTADLEKYPSGFDRDYDAEDFNRFMGTFFDNGVFVKDDANACKVTAAGLKLTVTPGIVLVDGSQCHFETGDSLTLGGAGLYSIMCRRNSAAGVRAFELVAVKGASSYPNPVREGDLYDMCLARVNATASTATVTDTRSDGAVCGYAALTGQPPYYPPDDANLPYVLWLYTLGFPMTAVQKAAVEGNPSLMAIYNQTKLVPATQAQAEAGVDNTKFMTPARVKRWTDTSILPFLNTLEKVFEATSPGSYSITIPADAALVYAVVAGAGGGGGGGNRGYNTGDGGGGGSGGSVAVLGPILPTNISMKTAVVGAGGAGGRGGGGSYGGPGGPGSNGGTSSLFGVTCYGGKGGGKITNNDTPGTGAVGISGQASGGSSDNNANVPGGIGDTGKAVVGTLNIPGSGGGGGGPNEQPGGAGGAFSGGAGGAGGNPPKVGTAGRYGGGGGGGGNGTGVDGAAGGAGGAGYVVVYVQRKKV